MPKLVDSGMTNLKLKVKSSLELGQRIGQLELHAPPGWGRYCDRKYKTVGQHFLSDASLEYSGIPTSWRQ